MTLDRNVSTGEEIVSKQGKRNWKTCFCFFFNVLKIVKKRIGRKFVEM